MSGNGLPTGGRPNTKPTRRRLAAYLKIRAVAQRPRVTTSASPTSGFHARYLKAARTCARRTTAAVIARRRDMRRRSTPRQAMLASDASREKGIEHECRQFAREGPEQDTNEWRRESSRSASHGNIGPCDSRCALDSAGL